MAAITVSSAFSLLAFLGLVDVSFNQVRTLLKDED